ncbi:MAG: redoxin family protein [Fuerstiella sp.]|nr:redoxin family protein [Fuerstiella sp.]
MSEFHALPVLQWSLPMKAPAVLMLIVLVLAGCQDSSSPSQKNSSVESTTQTDSTTGADSSAAETETDSEVTERVSVTDPGILAPGSPAGDVAVKVVHGAPFESIQSGSVYVVEFWATWCGPCLAGMPHLSELQNQYQGKVQFIGVTEEDEGHVMEFLKQDGGNEAIWADVLTYTIAVDQNQTTHKEYFFAAQQRGIPCAFIVNAESSIAWIGHPAQIDGPLEAVVNGTWDLDRAREEFLSSRTPSEPPAQPVVQVEPLAPGIDAPAVQTAAVVQGAGVDPFQEGNVYVVEFWATWCGPCLQSMPHISTLQEEYGDAVQFIGVTREDAETVTGFMQQQSPSGQTWADTLGYTIALDDDSSTWENYMTAADQGGIPCAFIVEQTGKVAWIGHPMNIDEPLASVVNGDFDVAAAAKIFETEKQLQPALRSRDFERSLEILNTLLESDPSSLQYRMMKMQVLSMLNRPTEMVTLAAGLVKEHAENARLQNHIAWFLCNHEGLTPEGFELAFQAANTANQITDGSDPSILDTMARVHYRRRDLKAAVEWQKKAVALDTANEGIQQTLQEYEAELAEQSSQSAADSETGENSDTDAQTAESGA